MPTLTNLYHLGPKLQLALLALLLAACGPSGFASEPTAEPCLPADLVAPEHTTPATDYEIIFDLDHIFVWSYDSCEPDGWRVELVPHDPETYTQYPAAITEVGLPVPAQTSWIFDGVLQPATAYEWHVAAFEAGVVGPYSQTTIFWTGPLCADNELEPPTQLSPADESVLDTPEGPFKWDYPSDCVPEFTFLDIGTTPGFPGETLGTGLGPPRLLSYPAEPLEDCSEYYWRVRNESQDENGSWSPVWSFTTDFDGTCDEQGDQPAGPGNPPMGLATRDLNCRAGDSQVFTETGFFADGEEAEILGRNQQGSWLVVPLRLGGGNCWVSALYVDLLDDTVLDDLEVFSSPPLPTATPTTLPEANPFVVTNVSVSVDIPRYSGGCPVQFTFTAQITTSGAGTVEFRWLRSDQVQASVETLQFSSAGTQQVQSTWDISGGVHTNLWKQVEILAPNSLLSNQATFSATCQ